MGAIFYLNGCEENYIGKTTLTLRMRLNIHRQQIRDPKMDKFFLVTIWTHARKSNLPYSSQQTIIINKTLI